MITPQEILDKFVFEAHKKKIIKIIEDLREELKTMNPPIDVDIDVRIFVSERDKKKNVKNGKSEYKIEDNISWLGEPDYRDINLMFFSDKKWEFTASHNGKILIQYVNAPAGYWRLYGHNKDTLIFERMK